MWQLPRGGGSDLPTLSLFLLQCCEVGPPDGLQQPGKLTSVFINTTQGRSSKKKRLVKGVFNCGKCPGWKSGYLGWAAAVPGKLTSVFIITAQGRSSKKKRLVKGVLIVASTQGRRFGSAGAVGWAAAVPGKLTSVFINTTQGEAAKKEPG